MTHITRNIAIFLNGIPAQYLHIKRIFLTNHCYWWNINYFTDVRFTLFVVRSFKSSV